MPSTLKTKTNEWKKELKSEQRIQEENFIDTHKKYILGNIKRNVASMKHKQDWQYGNIKEQEPL